MAEGQEKGIGVNQFLQPLLSVLGRLPAEGDVFKELREFVDEHAEQILQAKPLLESDGLVELIGRSVPGAKAHELRVASRLLIDLAEQSVKNRNPKN
ncbi:MAG: hypothetical protein GX316_04320 [Firmicutes bacterium]|nr:hypothetical protein [Bacillota bacterium]